MTLDDLLHERCARLAREHLLRSPHGEQWRRAHAGAEASGLPLLDVSSNDYLAAAGHDVDVSRETLGAGASRLLNGTRPAHEALERGLVEWLGAASALVFSSGYAANVGALSCLPERGDVLISDALNHASIIDGCRLSRATTVVVAHRDAGAVEAALRAHPGRAWVVTESYFSMDGTTPDLGRLRRVCDEHGAFLVVDEAHALGTFGPAGRGLCAAAGVRPDVLVGTFGKAFGGQGAFVAGPRRLREFLWNRARSFVFSTAMSPALAAALVQRLDFVGAADEVRARLARLAERLAATAASGAWTLPAGRHGPIFPVLLGSAVAALRAADHLASKGILAPAIRPPTVPEGQSRIRISLTARMSDADVERLARGVDEALRGFT